MWVLFFFPFRILALQENFLLQFKMDVSGDISLDWFLLPVLLYISGKSAEKERKDGKLFIFLVIMINTWLK